MLAGLDVREKSGFIAGTTEVAVQPARIGAAASTQSQPGTRFVSRMSGVLLQACETIDLKARFAPGFGPQV
jgi:hypothetical protein